MANLLASILVNECAPRPHNSGHLTIEALPQMSQFKAQACSILDLIPNDLNLAPRTPAAIMVNILGGTDADSHEKLVRLARTSYHDDVDVHLHLYGKASKPGRKIGHITLVARVGSDFTIEHLERFAKTFISQASEMRAERIAAASQQLRPEDVVKKAPVGGGEKPLVIVTMGSDSDLPVMRAGIEILEKFKVPFVVRITSAHRTAGLMSEVARTAANQGIKVIIAGAGGAAHLPGMIAAQTSLPVIGVPVKATHLDGQDSLLSIVQMPVCQSFPLEFRFLVQPSGPFLKHHHLHLFPTKAS
jgi:phosphoribosylaminoimidazole carboxylase